MNVKELIAYLSTLPEDTILTTFEEERARYETIVSTVPLTEVGLDYLEACEIQGKKYPPSLHIGNR